MRRWLFRLFIFVFLVLLLAVIGIQVILSTDLPRRLVLEQVQRQLQLRVAASSLTTGWTGHTVLHDVTLALPLSSDAFLQMKTLEVNHSGILSMVVSQGVTVRSLQFDSPTLLVQQDSTGRWNVAEVADLIRRAAGGKQAANQQQQQKTTPGPLPKITLTDGSVRIVDNTGRTTTIEPLNVSGAPENDLVWRYDALAGSLADPNIRITGKVAPGEGFKHELTVGVKNLEPWFGAFAGAKPGAPSPLQGFGFAAAWQGVATDAGVEGLLKNMNVTAGTLSVKNGSMAIQVRDGVVTFRPENVPLAGVPEVPTAINLRGGNVILEGAGVRVENLLATLAQGDARVNARYGYDGSADVNAEWHQVVLPAKFKQDGTLKAELRNQWPSGRRMEGTLVSTGSDPAGQQWDTVMKLTGLTRSVDKQIAATQPNAPGAWSMDWTLTADRLRLTRGKNLLNLDKLTAKLTQTPGLLALTNVNVPDDPKIRIAGKWPRGTIDARGWLKTETSEWGVWVTGDQWRLKDSSTAAKFSLDAWSAVDPQTGAKWTYVDNLYLETGGIRTWAAGRVSSGERNPSHLEVYTWYPSFALDVYDAGTGLQAGSFYSELTADGLLDPIFFDVRGVVRGKDVVTRGRPVGDVSMDVRGQVDGAKDDLTDIRASLWTQHLKLFDGLWSIRGEYTSNRNHKLGGDEWDDGININVDLESLALKQLDAFVSPPPSLEGDLTGHWEIAVPRAQFAEMGIGGNWQVNGFKTTGFVADRITGKLTIDKGDVTIDQVRVVRDVTGKIPGQIDASAKFRLKTPTQMRARAAVAAWPVDAPAAKFSTLIYGQLGSPDQAIDVDFGKLSARGPFQFRTPLTLRGHDVGELHIAGDLAGRVVNITDISGNPFGGFAKGNASINLDDWQLKSGLALTWKDIEADAFITLFPALADLDGRFSGSIVLGPPTDSRPLGVRQLTVNVKADEGKWRTIDLDDASVTLFYDPSEAEPDNRIQRLIMGTSVLHVANGTIHPFARLTKRPLENVWAYDGNTDFETLSLDQIAHAFDPKLAPMPGKLAGNVKVIGNPREKKRVVGEATVGLTETDLGRTGPISALYSALSFKFSSQPTGRATISLRLEDDTASVTNFHFFNQGLEARASGPITDVTSKGPQAGLDVWLIGSVRPLKDLKLPFAADLDKIFSAIQGNVTTLHITGTLHDPKISSGVFADVGSGLRQLILGDVRGETKNSAGQ